MNIKYCDKCGKHICFSDTLTIKSGIDGSTKCTFDICHDCANKLIEEITNFKKSIITKLGDIN